MISVQFFFPTLDMGYLSNMINSIQLLAIKFRQRTWYDEFNSGRSSLQDEFREGRRKSVVPETML